MQLGPLFCKERVSLQGKGPYFARKWPYFVWKGPYFVRKGLYFVRKGPYFVKKRALICNDGQDVSGCMALIVSYPRHNTFEESPFQGQFGNDKELASA